ncbi:MAG: hypothetical protein J7L32_05020 [Thermoplasmata archaeon]|nr:hypothetical protein [Thermoplasmata archaeon]
MNKTLKKINTVIIFLTALIMLVPILSISNASVDLNNDAHIVSINPKNSGPSYAVYGDNVTSPYSGKGLHITPGLNWCYMKIPQGKTTYQDFGVWYGTTKDDKKVYNYKIEVEYPVNAKPEEKNWITVYPSEGSLVPEASHTMLHEILIDTSNLSIPKTPFYADFYGGTLRYTHVAHVTAVCGDERATMEVRINVVNGKDGPTLKYWPPRLEFSPNDPDGTSQTFEIWNSGSGVLTYSFNTLSSWIEVSPTSGTSRGEKHTITVTIYPSKKPGCGFNSDKVGYVYIKSNGGVAPPGSRVGEGRITVWRWTPETWNHDVPVGCNNSHNKSLRTPTPVISRKNVKDITISPPDIHLPTLTDEEHTSYIPNNDSNNNADVPEDNASSSLKDKTKTGGINPTPIEENDNSNANASTFDEPDEAENNTMQIPQVGDSKDSKEEEDDNTQTPPGNNATSPTNDDPKDAFVHLTLMQRIFNRLNNDSLLKNILKMLVDRQLTYV